MGKFKDPSADFVLEVIKTLDEEDLIPIAQYLTQRLQEQPTVIDIEPTPTPRTEPKQPLGGLNINSLAGLLNSDSIGTLLQLVAGGSKTPDLAPPPGEELDGTTGLIAKLPKLLQMGSEALQQSSREERLIAAIVPFVSGKGQSSLYKLQNYMRLFNLMRQLPNALSGLNKK